MCIAKAHDLPNYYRVFIYSTHLVYELPLPLFDLCCIPSGNTILEDPRCHRKLTKAYLSPKSATWRDPIVPAKPNQNHTQRHHSASPFFPPHLGHTSQPNIPLSQAFHPPSYYSYFPLSPSDLVQPTPHITGSNRPPASPTYTPLLQQQASKQTIK